MRSKCTLLSVIVILLLGVQRRALEIGRLIIHFKLSTRLKRQYKKVIREHLKEVPKEQKKGKYIWFCWLQGLNDAPPIVKKCYESLHKYIIGKEIILITEKNYVEYVDIPDFILEKYKRGYITKTHFSDVLRLELLIKWGGTWIDSTVYCTGDIIPDYMLNSTLFLFQKLKPGSNGNSIKFSSWFITAYSNHPILVLTKKIIYAYWKKHTKLNNYFLFHLILQIAMDTYINERDAIMPFSNAIPHILLLRINNIYNKELWDEVTRITPFHKLSYKGIETNHMGEEISYYQYIIGSR